MQVEELTALGLDEAQTQAVLAAFEALKAEMAQKEEAFKQEVALKDLLAGERFTSDYARKGVFEDLKAMGLVFENGAFAGFAEALAVVKQNHPDAFFVPEAAETEVKTAKKVDLPPVGDVSAQNNPFLKETRNVTEQGRLYRDNPELAAFYARQAGVRLPN